MKFKTAKIFHHIIIIWTQQNWGEGEKWEKKYIENGRIIKKKILETQYNDDYCNVFPYRVCLFYHNLNSGCFFINLVIIFIKKSRKLRLKSTPQFIIMNKWTPHLSCQQFLLFEKIESFLSIYLMKLFIHTSSKPFLETIKSSKKKPYNKIFIYEHSRHDFFQAHKKIPSFCRLVSWSSATAVQRRRR